MFDRYYHDYIIDPLRHRVKISPIITNYFQFVIPKPDIIIILTASSKIIHARKAELPLDIINNQQARLRLLSKNEQTAFLLDSSQNKQKVCAEIITIIFNKLANR